MSMFESIRQGLQEAIDFAEGKPVKVVEHDVSPPDVKAVREHVGMTQAEFAAAFGISLGIENYAKHRLIIIRRTKHEV